MLTVGGKGSSQKRTPAEADDIDPRKPVREGLPGRPPSLDFQSVITIIPIYSNARLLGRFSYLSAWLGYQHGKGRRSEHAVLRNASLRSAPRAKEAVSIGDPRSRFGIRRSRLLFGGRTTRTCELPSTGTRGPIANCRRNRALSRVVPHRRGGRYAIVIDRMIG